MQDLFADAMQQLLESHCSPAAVREIERGGNIDALWRELEASGFIDALVDDARGGAGLGLSEIFSIVIACGRFALPVPMAYTMLVRALAANAELSRDPITIAPTCTHNADGSLQALQVPFARTAEWVVVTYAGEAQLLPIAAASCTPAGGNGCLDADLHWQSQPKNAIPLDNSRDWNLIGAAATAALMAGALEKILEMTLTYANERIQFGKPIGKLQAIQQQLSVLAENVFSGRMAAQIGFLSDTAMPNVLRGAVAKERTSAVAAESAAIAHAVHGAMGFTEEYDLQLYTRRLHEWRMAYGAETFWSTRLGEAMLQSDHNRSLDFVRERIMA
jgi:alkylation response protein AidB-like acyl-CoA dehydrogenase